MKILAIDPGYERLGVAILEKNIGDKKENLVFSSCIRTKSDTPFESRLGTIGEELEKIIEKYKPEALSIENLFISNNQKTAMRVAEVRGAIIYICVKNGLEIKEYTPLQIKLAVTGSGKSTKDQMFRMIKMLIPNIKTDALDDEYDAIAIGITYFTYLKTIITGIKK